MSSRLSSRPLFLSSGDPALDRRLDWARALIDEGAASDAAALLDETVERAPQFLAGWFLLGETREATGDQGLAVAAYGRALALDPEDALGAGARLARLGADAGLSAAYVRTLFDQYAGRFDDALARLGYRGPELLEAALRSACATLGRPYHFTRALDLGCGTGLVGERLAPVVDRLEGCDLSPAMIEQARQRGCYASLEVADMADFLRRQPEASADLVVAGDALCYLGDLAPVLARTGLTLQSSEKDGEGGLFAFTVETHDGDGVVLRGTLRYAHARPHLLNLLQQHGFRLISCDHAPTRSEAGAPVPGLVVVAVAR